MTYVLHDARAARVSGALGRGGRRRADAAPLAPRGRRGGARRPPRGCSRSWTARRSTARASASSTLGSAACPWPCSPTTTGASSPGRQEVKDLGVPMGAPFFKHKRELAEAGVRVFSLQLHLVRRHEPTGDGVPGDVHAGRRGVLDRRGVPERADARGDARGGLRGDGAACAAEIRARVLRWTGIPVRVSLAETKTLAKAASEWAKARLEGGRRAVRVPVGSPGARGVARARCPSATCGASGGGGRQRCEALGGDDGGRVRGAADRRPAGRFNVVLLRTAMELRGRPVPALDGRAGAAADARASRASFGRAGDGHRGDPRRPSRRTRRGRRRSCGARGSWPGGRRVRVDEGVRRRAAPLGRARRGARSRRRAGRRPSSRAARRCLERCARGGATARGGRTATERLA